MHKWEPFFRHHRFQREYSVVTIFQLKFLYQKELLMAMLHSLIARRWIGRQTPVWSRPKAIHFSWLVPELSSVAWSTGAHLIIFFCFRFSAVSFDRPGISIRHAAHCICRVLVFASSQLFNLIYLLTVKIR